MVVHVLMTILAALIAHVLTILLALIVKHVIKKTTIFEKEKETGAFSYFTIYPFFFLNSAIKTFYSFIFVYDHFL